MKHAKEVAKAGKKKYFSKIAEFYKIIWHSYNPPKAYRVDALPKNR